MSDKGPIHVFDGIEEEDNHLPNWWLAILFGTIAFGFLYWFLFHTTRQFPTHEDDYRADVTALKKARLAENPTSDEAIIALLQEPEKVEEGKKVFSSTCAACHAADAQGLVGPNLTDKYWIHGNKPTDIVKSVTEGFPEKGMPAWGQVLGPDKVRKVAAFVLAQKGKNLPGKEPQGEAVE